MGEHNHIVQRDGITYFMTDIEFRHADEWIDAIKQEVNERAISWERKKQELYEKWEREELPFE